MDEDAIKAEARLFGLESLVALLHAAHHQASGGPAGPWRMRAELVDRARHSLVGEVDPVSSDLVSAELEIAIDAAIAHQGLWLGLEPAHD